MSDNIFKTTKIDPWANYSLFVALISIYLVVGSFGHAINPLKNGMIETFVLILAFGAPIFVIISGIIALRRIKQDDQLKGKVYAIIGIIIGLIEIVLDLWIVKILATPLIFRNSFPFFH